MAKSVILQFVLLQISKFKNYITIKNKYDKKKLVNDKIKRSDSLSCKIMISDLNQN